MLHPMTIDLREQWNPERSAAVFDKKGEDGVYAYVEADLLTRLALVEGYGVSAWYCLYGNLEKGTYGVVRFSELYEEYILLGEDEKTAVFPEPLLLYGLTMEMPACIEGLPLEQPAQSDPVIIPGTTAVLPDGTELEIPDREAPQVTVSDEIVLEEIIEEDSSREAMAFFANYGIDVSTDWTPGSVYLAGSVQPETDEAPINQFLDTVWIILLLLAFVLLIPLFRYGSRADYEEVIIQRINRGDSMIPMLADTCTRQEKERMEIPEPGNE